MAVHTLAPDDVTALHLQDVFKSKLMNHIASSSSGSWDFEGMLIEGGHLWLIFKWGSFYSFINPFC